MSKLKDTSVEGNLNVSGNLKCTGTINMGGGKIAGRNIPTKISFSRYMRWEQTNNAQSGTQTCSFTSIFDGTSGNLADNEFISSVSLTSGGSGQYSNSAIPFITGFSHTTSSASVSWYRNANDGNNLLRIFITVCKYE